MESLVLDTKDVDIREIKRTLLENFLGILANTNLAFLLLTIGGLGILAEFLTPGFIGPGVVGAIALALAFLGMGQLSAVLLGSARGGPRDPRLGGRHLFYSRSLPPLWRLL